MYRRAIAPLIAVLVSGCSADSVLSVHGDIGTTPEHGSLTSTDLLTRVDLGTLGGASSYAADVNSANTVVGWAETASGSTHAFRWTAGDGMVDLGTLPRDVMSRAIAVLDGSYGDTQILGVSGNGTQWTPVVWSTSGAISALPIPLLPSFDAGSPSGFNVRGDIVGSDAGSSGQHAWVWRRTGGKYDLSANVQGGSNEGLASAVSGAGVVLLTTHAWTCVRAVECWRTSLWTNGGGFKALGTPDSDAEADVTGFSLNDAGTVVGAVTRLGKGTAPYRWDPSTGFKVLPNHSASTYGYATAINSSSTAVGASLDPTSGSIVATAWPSSSGIMKLSPNDVNPSIAVAISNAGTIAGWAAVSAGVNHAVIWKALPQTARTNLTSPIVGGARFSTASSSCLTDARSIVSRGALLSCVAKADLKR